MPANRTDGKNFWIGWTDTTNGGNIVIVNSGGTTAASQKYHVDHQRFAAYVSLAAHKALTNDCHIAYQECDEGLPNVGWLSHIFYATATYNGTAISVTNPLNISSPFGHCLNEFPQISVTKKGVVDVTWQMVQRAVDNGGGKGLLSHATVYRNRDIKKRWGKTLTIFSFNRTTLPIGDKDTVRLYPNILHANGGDPNPAAWTTLYRLMWNDPLTNSAAMAIFGRSDTVGGSLVSHTWELYTMAEPSMEPALPHLSVGDRIVHPLLYRFPYPRENGNFDARITQYNFPATTLVPAAITVAGITLQPPHPATGEDPMEPPCNPNLRGLMAPPHIRHDTNAMVVVPFMQAANSGDDSTKVDTLKWDDNEHARTENFHIETNDTVDYSRFFTIGYNPGDTTNITFSLVDSNDYVKMRLLMRKSDNTLMMVLDSAVLKKSGFTQSADTSNGGVKSFVVPSGIDDSVYLSLEASRKDTNKFTLTKTEIYCDTTLIDLPPSYDSVISYKKSDPSASQPSYREQIKVKIAPNPFNSAAKISIDAPKDVPLTVTLFDELGRKISDLANGMVANSHSEFTLTSETLSTGFYYVRVQSGNEAPITRKIQLIK
jgi:hypothetical protein